MGKADFLQRIRSYNFLIALGGCIFLIYSFVPALDAGYTMVSLGNYRGFYNSAWIGSMVANCVPFFALIGFYVVNYAVKRDIDTGVGQIIATTRITKLQYFTGKLLSNFAVLFVMLVVIAAMTIIMFLVRGETSNVEFGKLLLPLLIIPVPAMFIVASIALIFDSFTNLSGGPINIIYFFLWTVLIGLSMSHPFLDVFGFNTTLTEITGSISTIHPDWNGESGTGILLRDPADSINVFTWEGMNWTTSILLQRIFWMLASYGFVLLTSLGFSRFDTSIIRETKLQSKGLLKTKSILTHEVYIPSKIKFQDVPIPETRFSFFSLMMAEIRLMVKGNSKLWLVFSSVLFIISIFTPLNFAYRIALPLLWFFQTLILSKLGSREIKNRCNEYIFSAAFPLKRQLPAMLTAATIFMVLLASPVVIRVVFVKDLYNVYAIVVGALFIPAFAITLGIITGGSKLFEVIFTIIVYGYFNGAFFFDFIGAINESHELGIAHYLFVTSLALIILAFSVRKRQITHS